MQPSPFCPPQVLLIALNCWGFDWKSGNDSINSWQEEEFHNERKEVPRQDEATANHVRSQGHDLSHCQWGQDVGHLIYPPHGCIHSYCCDQTHRDESLPTHRLSEKKKQKKQELVNLRPLVQTNFLTSQVASVIACNNHYPVPLDGNGQRCTCKVCDICQDDHHRITNHLVWVLRCNMLLWWHRVATSSEVEETGTQKRGKKNNSTNLFM